MLMFVLMFPCSGLNQHVSSLWTCVSGLNETIIRHGGLLDFIQSGQDDIHSRVKNLNSSLNQVSRDLQGLSEHELTGELLLPLPDAALRLRAAPLSHSSMKRALQV